MKHLDILETLYDFVQVDHVHDNSVLRSTISLLVYKDANENLNYNICFINVLQVMYGLTMTL